MREILFRGKCQGKGEWVEGFLVDAQHIGNWVEAHPVDPETVGQFTGLTDKHGKKIFEGDILKFSDYGIYPVWWDADFFTFGSCWFSDFDPLYKYERNKIEVIGNIHDNPELLGGEGDG